MKDGRPVVLVTGASGFVGRHLCPVLVREGWIVRRAVRRPSGSDDEVVIETIGPTTEWSTALAEVDAVVHLAARVHHPNEEQAGALYRSINTQGTLQLARGAVKAGVKKFVYVSTVLVNGSSTDGRSPFREGDEVAPRGVYGTS
ncbi:MAG TPA: NAD-dependent epimerase/dehydratase family protein, partial [Steroidobacteraceae bacterium]|nr:NAD-dependent epimerase/dehydratase family protein [Steroidobacteraceae bacterium]